MLPTRRFPGYAEITATVALVLVLGGGSALAAGKITSKQIKNGTIKSRDVHASTLTGAQVADHSLTAADLAPGTVPAGPPAYGRYHDGPVTITGGVTGVPVLTLPVPAGSFAISAKSWLINNYAGPVPPASSDLECTLTAGGDSDTVIASTSHADSGATAPNRVSVSLQVLHTFAAAGNVVLSCNGFGVPSQANKTKIHAIQVGSINNSAG